MAQILSTGYQRAGDQSQVQINNGAQVLNWASWNVSISGHDLPTTNFGSFVTTPGNGWTTGQSFEEGILGPVSSSQSFGGLWDAHANVLNDPPGLFPRDDLANVFFTINRTDATHYNWPYMRIRGVNCKSDVNATVGFDVGNALSQGPFYFPTTSV